MHLQRARNMSGHHHGDRALGKQQGALSALLRSFTCVLKAEGLLILSSFFVLITCVMYSCFIVLLKYSTEV